LTKGAFSSREKRETLLLRAKRAGMHSRREGFSVACMSQKAKREGERRVKGKRSRPPPKKKGGGKLDNSSLDTVTKGVKL